MNFNDDIQLWKNMREHYTASLPNGGPMLQVFDGHISDGTGIIARFNNTAEAEHALTQAGFKMTSEKPGDSLRSSTWKATQPVGSVFNDAQMAELRRLRAYFPFRIVWGGFDNNGKFSANAHMSRRQLNNFLRKPGHIAATLG